MRVVLKPGAVPFSEREAEALAQQFIELYFAEITNLFNRVIVPKLQRATPVRTGNLRGAFRVWREGNMLNIGFHPRGYYWEFVDGLNEKYQTITQRDIPVMAELAFQRTREKMGL